MFGMLSGTNNKYKLLLIGDGELKKEIIKENEAKPFMNNIIFIDYVPNIYDYVQAMDIFILPSKFEGLGIVLIEAQAAGCKCIASTNVPKEVQVTDNIEFVELDEQKWINTIESTETNHDRNVRLYDESYDIKNTTKVLSDFYIKIGGKNE